MSGDGFAASASLELVATEIADIALAFPAKPWT
jgi:hypothetical protein